MAQANKKRLGEMLIEQKLIDQLQLEAAIGRQKQWGGMLGANLVKLGYISEITLLKFLGNQLHLPCADLSKINFKEETYSLITIELAKKYHTIPLETKDAAGRKILFIAISEPTNLLAIDEISFLTGLTVRPVIATDTQIAKAIEKFYQGRDWIDIEPLSEKVKDVSGASSEIVHEVTLKEKEEIKYEEVKKKEHVEKNPELLALIRVLVKKGILSRDEYVEELQQLKSKM